MLNCGGNVVGKAVEGKKAYDHFDRKPLLFLGTQDGT